MGLKMPRKREIAYPWAVYDLEKVRMGHCRPISRKTNGHDKALGERVNNRPKKAQQD